MAKLNVTVGSTIRTLLPMRVYRWWVSDDIRCAVDLIFRDCSFMYFQPGIGNTYTGQYGDKANGDPRAVYFVDGVYTLEPTADNLWAAKYPAVTASGDYTYKIISEAMTYTINQGDFYFFFASIDDWLASNPESCYGSGYYTVEEVETTLPVYDYLTATWIPVSFPYTVYENGTIECPIIELPVGTTGAIGYVDSAIGCDGKKYGTITWNNPLLLNQPYLIELDDTIKVPYQTVPPIETLNTQYNLEGQFVADVIEVDYTAKEAFEEIELLVYEVLP